MPFEPLRTDEKLASPEKGEPDMDSRMLVGCSGFLTGAVGVYALAAWPWWLFEEVERWRPLLLCLGLGLLPASIFGLALSRRTGVSGACGTLGGASVATAFVFLRLRQTVDAYHAHHLPRPEWPEWVSVGLPLGWLAVLGGLAFLSVRRAPD